MAPSRRAIAKRLRNVAILERTAAQLAELCRHANDLLREARAAGHHDDLVEGMGQAMLEEVLSAKHALDTELRRWAPVCLRCERNVHWVAGAGCDAGHWAHADRRRRITDLSW